MDGDTTPKFDGKYYEVATPDSLAERLAARARDRIYADFLRLAQPTPSSAILDVGVSDIPGDAANLLERLYPFPDRITAAGLGPGEAFRVNHPMISYFKVTANQPLPFTNGSFDIATSNAVLEHVGSAENQRHFVAELSRVARRVFITVPHRYFPVEHHTGIPLLHWTDLSFKLACRLTAKTHWSRPEELILMSARRLRAAVPRGANLRIDRTGILLGPFSSNLVLYSA